MPINLNKLSINTQSMTSVTPCPNNWSETTEPKCPGKGNANNCRWYKEKSGICFAPAVVKAVGDKKSRLLIKTGCMKI